MQVCTFPGIVIWQEASDQILLDLISIAPKLALYLFENFSRFRASNAFFSVLVTLGLLLAGRHFYSCLPRKFDEGGHVMRTDVKSGRVDWLEPDIFRQIWARICSIRK